MASDTAGGMGRTRPGAQGQQSSKPDPMVQPALANAMRLGQAFKQMSPSGAGRMAVEQPQPGMLPQRSPMREKGY